MCHIHSGAEGATESSSRCETQPDPPPAAGTYHQNRIKSLFSGPVICTTVAPDSGEVQYKSRASKKRVWSHSEESSLRCETQPDPPPAAGTCPSHVSLAKGSGDTTPCRMTGVTLHSHVRYKEIQARTCCGPLFSSVKPLPESKTGRHLSRRDSRAPLSRQSATF